MQFASGHYTTSGLMPINLRKVLMRQSASLRQARPSPLQSRPLQGLVRQLPRLRPALHQVRPQPQLQQRPQLPQQRLPRQLQPLLQRQQRLRLRRLRHRQPLRALPRHQGPPRRHGLGRLRQRDPDSRWSDGVPYGSHLHLCANVGPQRSLGIAFPGSGWPAWRKCFSASSVIPKSWSRRPIVQW